jgi:hypothetical protein
LRFSWSQFDRGAVAACGDDNIIDPDLTQLNAGPGTARAAIGSSEDSVMKYSDETLMAFADGELDAATRSAIEQAMRQDPAIAQRVAQHQALRADVFAAFFPVLDEPVPPMTHAPLLQKAAPPRGGTVIQLAAVRASKGQAQAVPVKSAPRWPWPMWGALAATLVVGVVAGRFALPLLEGEPSLPMAALGKGGTLRAQGKLASALTHQAANDAGSGVKIGLSFVSNQGNYCRSFVLAGAVSKSPMAGLACQGGSGVGWRIAAIAEEVQPASAPGSYRMAGAEMPPAILAAIDQRIAGQALDAAAEQQALRRGWRR